ncbi:MAG: hypothetical protein IPG69_17735 [Flavobacteriales bacterium]|nr:hypothetical protein [Flavobacteriales bacterium]
MTESIEQVLIVYAAIDETVLAPNKVTLTLFEMSSITPPVRARVFPECRQ